MKPTPARATSERLLSRALPASSRTADALLQWGVLQLTGRHLDAGRRMRLRPGPADPSLYETSDGKLQLHGTGPFYLEYGGWGELLGGHEPEWKAYRLCQPDGTRVTAPHAAWDALIHRWPDGGEVLYAGVMTPTGESREARWPHDNWNRRIYPFRREGARWVREAEPLFAKPERPSYIDHCYGHHFLEDESGDTWLFFEKVTDDGGRHFPLRTELFARRMETPWRASSEEVQVLGLGDRPYPATRRTIGGHLMEGPRPAKLAGPGGPLYFIGFSSGDFPTDGYSMNVAWSRAATGPYRPLLTPDGGDLLDLGLPLKRAFPLSWGPARPCFFEDPGGRWWVLFHAVDKQLHPATDFTRWPRRLDAFHRNVYLAPVAIRVKSDGSPEFRVGLR